MVLAPLLVVLLLVADSDGRTATDQARFALHPALVEVGVRCLTYTEKNDWKRVSSSLRAVYPLAKALDVRWGTDLEERLRGASRAQDAEQTARAVLRLVYWDTVDLLAPLEDAARQANPKEIRSRILKARQGLRFLAPVIEKSKALDENEQPVKGRVALVQLHRILSTSINCLPSDRKFGKVPDWRSRLVRDTARFRTTFKVVLPDLHGKPRAEVEDSE